MEATVNNGDSQGNVKQIYTHRMGTRNFGYDYERNMFGLYALRLSLNNNIEDMRMALNVDGYGDFDDILIRVNFVKEKPKLFLFQLKHKENKSQTACKKMFNTKKGEFNLQKYKKSYEDIVKKIGNEEDDFIKGLSLDDLILCFFTNMVITDIDSSFPIDSTLDCKLQRNITDDFINTKSNGFCNLIVNATSSDEDIKRKEQEYSIFFKSLRFYDAQVNHEEARSQFTSLLKTSFGDSCPDFSKKFINYIKNYFKESERTEDYKDELLSKRKVKMKLLELLTGIKDEKSLERKYKVFENVTTIYDPDQMNSILKEIKVSLQGRDSLSLFELTNKSFCEKISTVSLLRNIGETVSIGINETKKPDVYIKRSFYKILLKNAVLWETKKNIFIFNDVLPHNLSSKLMIMSEVEVNTYTFYGLDDNLVIVVSQDKITDTINDIRRSSYLNSFSVHYLKVHDLHYLEWLRSWNNIEKLNSFIVYDELDYQSEDNDLGLNGEKLLSDRELDLVSEQDVLRYFQRPLNVVSASPGMGKTTILEVLAHYCERDKLVLKLDLNTQCNALQDFESELRKNPLEYIFNLMKLTRVNELETQLLQYLKELHKIILLIDGFDEISPKYSDTVLSIIDDLRSKKVRIWIFTRSIAVPIIKERFYILPIKMVHLTTRDITWYLENKLGTINFEVEKYLSKTTLTFYKSPQYLHMLSSICKSQSDIQQMRVIDLYEKFIDMCFDKQMEKLHVNKGLSNTEFLLNSTKILFLKIQETAALLEIFGKDYLVKNGIFKEKHIKKTIEQFNEYKNIFQLLVILNEESAVFTHRTYTEYFAASKIYKYLSENKFISLYERLCNKEFQSMRLMFNRICAKERPLHLAVIENDLDAAETFCNDSINFTKTDIFGRTVLHFAMNTLRHTNFDDKENLIPMEITNTLVQYSQNIKNIFHCRDNLLKKNFYEQIGEEEKRNLLHIAAYCGATHFLKLILHMNKDCLDWKESVSYLTALQVSVLKGEVDCARYLIEQGADITLKTKYGKTALHLAAEGGHLDVVNLLIQEDINVNERDLEGQTAIHSALYHGHETCVSALMEAHKNDIDAKTLAGWTAMHIAAAKGYLNLLKLLKRKNAKVNEIDLDGHTALHFAILYGHRECAVFLIEAGAIVDAPTSTGWTAVHTAAEKENIDILQLLIQKNAQIDKADSNGCTALHLALLNRHEKSIKFLIDAGADINLKTTAEWTALHLAAEKGFLDILQLLTKHEQVKLNEIDLDGHTALHIAAFHGHTECVECLIEAGAIINQGTVMGWTIMHIAAEKGDLDTLKLVIRENKLNINKQCNGRTALHFAVYNGHLKCVQYLVEAGANINLKTTSGWTALHIAADKGYSDILKLLIKQKNIDINNRLPGGHTALHRSSHNGHLKCLEYLLEVGANINIKAPFGKTSMHLADSEGHTALSIAIVQGHRDCVNLLISAGADINTKSKNDITPLHLAAERGHAYILKILIEKGGHINEADLKGLTPLHFAVLYGHVDCVNVLINAGANHLVTKKNITSMHIAAKKGHHNVLKLLLEKGEEDIDDVDYKGRTALHFAVSRGHQQCVNVLISADADVDLKTKTAKTPMHLAAEKGYPDILQLLTEKSKTTNETDSNGRTALHLAIKHEHLDCANLLLNAGADGNLKTQVDMTPLHFAAEKGFINVLKLLIQKGVHLDELDCFGRTALYLTIIHKHPDCANLLINAGADINLKIDQDMSVIHLVAQKGCVETMKLLKEKGVNINEADSKGRTALHLAALHGHLACVIYLIEEGTHTHLKAKRGLTVAHFAAKGGFVKVLKLLKEKNINVNEVDEKGRTALHFAAIRGHKDCVKYLSKICENINLKAELV